MIFLTFLKRRFFLVIGASMLFGGCGSSAASSPSQTLDEAVIFLMKDAPPTSGNFVRINGGTFTMGTPSNEDGRRDNEGPLHAVTIESFTMGKYEVTVEEFRKFVDWSGYKTTAETSGGGYLWTGSSFEQKADASWKNPYFSQGEKQPVVLVSWYDAVEYCNWLSKQEGLTPAYTRSGDAVTWNRGANGYRLPTEAEWEYACRAGTATAYWTGNDEGSLDGKANVADLTAKEKYSDWTVVNIRDGYTETAPVGSFTPNPWGLYDMHGNVWEWCWDWYGNYSSGSQTNPVGSVSGFNRVFRGGSWGSIGLFLRSGYRYGNTPSIRLNGLGFRLVRPAETPH